VAATPKLRLTFNEAAGKLLFEDGRCMALRVRLEERHVWMMGVALPTETDIPVTRRPKGGFEARAAGVAAERICRALKALGGPYFTFRRVLPVMTWYVPCAAEGEPADNEPSVTVW
jgi:hypothetical protein